MQTLKNPALATAPRAAAADTASKSHSSAVVVMPPMAIWHRIQAIRCLRDKSFVRWPPHINLLYPFHPDNTVDCTTSGLSGSGGARAGGGGDEAGTADPDAAFHQLALRAGRVLSRVPPFRVRLERLRTFRHSARSFTVWAEPAVVPSARVDAAAAGAASATAGGIGSLAGGGGGSSNAGGSGGGSGDDSGGDASGLHLVQSLLGAEFPACTDLSADAGRGISRFTPHLSLGQLRDESELEALQASWQPLEFRVDSVQLISRSGYLSPFTVRYHVPLGLDLDLDPSLDTDPDPRPTPDLSWRQGPQPGPSPGPGPRRMLCSADNDGVGGAGERRQRQRAVTRLDVPYVAMLANLGSCPPAEQCAALAEPGSSPSGVAGSSASDGLVRRFASPCLVLPPRHSAGAEGCPCAGNGRVTRPAPGVATGSGGNNGCGGRPHVPLCEQPGSSTGAENAGDSGSGCGPIAPGETRGGGGGAGTDAGSSVWWFAYGAAASATPEQVGALESAAAYLPGYQLALSRRGGRANLVPMHGAAEAHAPCATGGSGPPVPAAKPDGAADAGPAGAARGTGGGSDGDGAGAPSRSTCYRGPAVGVLHRLPVERMARLLLAADPEAWPEEVVCVPYGPAGAALPACSEGPAAASWCGAPGAPALAAQHAPLGTTAPDAAADAGPRPVVAVAFRVPAEGPLGGAEAEAAPPSQGYVAAPRQGAEQYGIPDPSYQSWLDRLSAAAEATALVPQGSMNAGGSTAAGGAAGGKRRRGAAARSRRTGADQAAEGLPRVLLNW